jgi:hypothetical protein
MPETRERTSNRALSKARRVLVLGITVPALLLFAGAVSQANAAPPPTAVTTMQSMQTPGVLGVCTSVQPNENIFSATGDTFSSCTSCVQIGHDELGALDLGADSRAW